MLCDEARDLARKLKKKGWINYKVIGFHRTLTINIVNPDPMVQMQVAAMLKPFKEM